MRYALVLCGLWAFTPGCANPDVDEGSAPPGSHRLAPASDELEPCGDPADAGTGDGGTPADAGSDGGTPSADLGIIDYVLPAPDAEAVGTNARVIVGFVEALDVGSVGPASLAVTENGAPLPGTVSHDANSRTLTFTPSRPFAPDALVTATVRTTVRTVSGRSLTAPWAVTFSVATQADTTAPTVLSTQPTTNEANVFFSRPVYIVTFQEPMDPRTLGTGTVQFQQVLGTGPAAPLFGTLAYHGPARSLLFRPNPLPAPGARVTGTLSTQVRDLAGNALEAPFTFTFAVAQYLDNAVPGVRTTSPAHQSLGVSTRVAPLLITYSEPLRADSVTTDRVYLEELNPEGTQVVRRVPGTVRYDETFLQVAFTPLETLKYQTRYRGRSRDVVDLAGNSQSLFSGFEFITELPPTPPLIRGATPAPDMRFVPLGGPLRVSFDRPLDPASVDTATVSVAGVTGLVNYEPSTNTVVFRPVPPLQPATEYTVTVQGVRTPQGQSLSTPFTYGFRTVAGRTKVSQELPGQPSLPVVATGPRGKLAVWNVNTGTGVQVRASFDSGAGFPDSVLVGLGRSMDLQPQVVAWGERFILSWSDALYSPDRVAIFDGTSFTPVAPASGKLFGVGSNLYNLSTDGKTFSILNGNQWSIVFRATYLGSTHSVLQNGDRVLVSSGYNTTSEVSVVFDGVQWLETSVTSSQDAQYLPVGDSFARAWVSSRGTEFALFNRDTRQWGAAELVSSTVSTDLRIATDGNVVTAVFGASSGLFASTRVNGVWQPAVSLDTASVRDIWALVSHRGNFLALWTTNSATTQLRAVTQTGGSWSSATKVVAATGVNRVLDVRATADDLLVLSAKNDLNSSAYEIWGTALTSLGWQPGTLLRAKEEAPAQFVQSGSVLGAVFVAPGQLPVRDYLGNGQWASAHPLATPERVGSVRNTAVHFLDDGRGVAAWEQFDSGAWGLWVAEYDGVSWLEPVRVAPGGTKHRVAMDESGAAVVMYLLPSTTSGKVDVWAVRYEAGVATAPLKLDTVTATDPDLVLVHGPAGFMGAWGEWEIRAAQSAEGQTWTPPVVAIARYYPEARWTNTRLAVMGASFALVAQSSSSSSLSVRLHTSGVWQTPSNPPMPSSTYDFIADGGTVMLMSAFTDEFRYIFHNGLAWSGQDKVSTPGENLSLMATSPQGIRLHTGNSWWRWSGAAWLKEATNVGRPQTTGFMRCDTKGCGLATGPTYSTPVNLLLSYAPGTGAFQSGASSTEASPTILVGGLTWDFAGGTYRATWRHPAQAGVDALYASTEL
ncbi:Ig-like domain-containing protein [Pyxidicoccus parkwayensis]|uniref:Ig-like domain-containing protein n=1 Tax=Pyxidicoccus parkwayensis TaxID=2813578 RepID=A0ABX7P0G7_9BACT|nr:Ig-like domain-containing protein [Pyxidicoccus parkwaysis]QSQ24223.1 Ig-like domain-containing protein [Pyxidicoccus parkwaysis]